MSTQANVLAKKFFETNQANEISETLSVMMEVYLQHAPVDRLNLANTYSLINKLSSFAVNLENSVTTLLQ